MSNFKEIDELTREQLDLFSATQSPSASASHSRYKNQISGRMKEIEEAKRELMQELLDMGLDPKVKVLDEEGKIKDMKLSEVLHGPVSEDLDETDSNDPVETGDNVVSLFKNRRGSDAPNHTRD
jgi:hypothetical protein